MDCLSACGPKLLCYSPAGLKTRECKLARITAFALGVILLTVSALILTRVISGIHPTWGWGTAGPGSLLIFLALFRICTNKNPPPLHSSFSAQMPLITTPSIVPTPQTLSQSEPSVSEQAMDLSFANLWQEAYKGSIDDSSLTLVVGLKVSHELQKASLKETLLSATGERIDTDQMKEKIMGKIIPKLEPYFCLDNFLEAVQYTTHLVSEEIKNYKASNL